jgi:uncharacterized membrane protein
MWAVGLIVGALLGASVDHDMGIFSGALIGLVLGLFAGQWKKALVERLSKLEERVELLARAVGAEGRDVAAARPAPLPASPIAAAEAEPPTAETKPADTFARTAAEGLPALGAASGEEPLPVRKGGVGAPPQPTAMTGDSAPPVDFGPPPSFAPKPFWPAWLAGGNTLARIGVVLLFIGVGFLVKYAAEHVRVPIELRLSAVALGGIALLSVGWRLRLRRPGYAMILQGGGVGVLYLTVFGALRLYALIPPTAAFALLFAIAALSAWLAVRQDAIALAALGVAGGFLAPVLTSTHTGNHVLLFGYYALLNAGIFGIAWFKAWRSLNLLGFVFTFIIGTFWGVTRYRPDDFATTEPFLVLFFLFYVGIAVLYALRQSVELRNYVDSTLVFGTPLVAAGLQSALVREMPYGMALSALAASALYLVLARLLHARRSENLRLLVEAFLALGVIFATVAIPLALDARWTSATWALEGAAMVWVGVRQRRIAVRIFGLLLQIGAGVAFGTGLTLWGGAAPAVSLPVLNSQYIGAVLVGLAGLHSAWLLDRRHAELKEPEQVVPVLLLVWGAAWWLAAGWREIEHWLPRDARLAALVGLLTLTAAAFALAERRLAWRMARVPAMLLLPALLVLAVASILKPWRIDGHLFAQGGLIAWPLAGAAVIILLRELDRRGAEGDTGIALPLDFWHAGLLWLITLVSAHELAWVGSHVGTGEGVWTVVPWGVVPALALASVCFLAAKPWWPIAPHRDAYLIVGAGALAVLLALWSLAANTGGDGDPLPLPYIPLFNPLDIGEALALIAMATWFQRSGRDSMQARIALHPGAAVAIFAVLLFVWINAIALRTIHFWFDVPYSFAALWHSRLVQAVLSLLWSSLALAAMLLANRRQWRVVWIAGAALLGGVVAKLFFVDLSQVGTVERIVSFIGVGLLLLLIGYLAPVPPRRPENPS